MAEMRRVECLRSYLFGSAIDPEGKEETRYSLTLEFMDEDNGPPYFQLDRETYMRVLELWKSDEPLIAKYEGDKLLGFVDLKCDPVKISLDTASQKKKRGYLRNP